MAVLQGDIYSATYVAPATATIVLTVTAPDGSTSTPAVVTASAPTYTSTVPATQVGAYLLTWVASGAAVDVFVDQFTVAAPSLRLISLSDVRDQLNISASDTTGTAKLQRFISSATDVIQNITGPILPTPRTDYFSGGQTTITLPFRWVKSITSVTEWWGGTTTYPLTQITPGSSAGAFCYLWDNNSNILTRMAGGFEQPYFGTQNAVTVIYTLGMATIPQDITDATGELIRHWWQNGQQPRSISFTNPGSDDDTGSISVMGYAVPNRVNEMLAPYARRPAIF